jgi:hypothetical protein
LLGTSANVFGGSALATSIISISGTIGLTLTGTSTIQGAGALLGTSSAQFTVTCTPNSIVTIYGQSGIVFTLSGTIIDANAIPYLTRRIILDNHIPIVADNRLSQLIIDNTTEPLILEDLQ